MTHGAVLFTVNVDRIARFYERVAGLTMGRADEDHVTLQGGAFRFVVHRIPHPYAATIVIAKPPEVRLSGAIKLAFPVTSIARARAAADELGGCVYGPDHEWMYGSSLVCDGWDCDGNVFQLLQASAG